MCVPNAGLSWGKPGSTGHFLGQCWELMLSNTGSFEADTTVLSVSGVCSQHKKHSSVSDSYF